MEKLSYTLSGKRPYIEIDSDSKWSVVHSLSGESRAHALMGVLNSYCGVCFQFTSLFMGNIGLKMYTWIKGEKVFIFFLSASDETRYVNCPTLSTFGRSALDCIDNLLKSMKCGGRFVMPRAKFGKLEICRDNEILCEVPPFSSTSELIMKFKLAGLEAKR